MHDGQAAILSQDSYDLFSKEGSGGIQDEFKHNGFCASEFHGALRERVFCFYCAWGVHLERPRLASWQMMMDTPGVC